MFSDLLENLKMKGGGIHGYSALAEAAHEKAKADPEKAAAYFIIAMAAESFIEAHERMPLSTPALTQSSDQLAQHIAKIEAAFSRQDEAEVLAALNALSRGLIAH